jgi:hypothetical protein
VNGSIHQAIGSVRNSMLAATSTGFADHLRAGRIENESQS